MYNLFDIIKDQRKLRDQIEALSKKLEISLIPVIKYHEQISRNMKQIRQRFKKAIHDGITGFVKPEQYNPNNVHVQSGTKKLAIEEGARLWHELGSSPFSYLLDRFKVGLVAFLKQDYQTAIFTFLSCLDGIMRKFCEQHKSDDCDYKRDYPTYKETREHLMEHFEHEIVVTPTLFEDRLKAFFLHRHEIMHGGENAYFDENVAVIALLFLGLTFSTVIPPQITP